jgi:hypothetical protein
MNPIAPCRLKPPEPVVPGGVYLCQVNDTVSCGACCGLYNRPDATRGRLQELLGGRTETFRRVTRDIDAIDAFRLETERREQCERPYADFYACPFLGLIGPHGSRPGCLLHPLADGNDGIDYRGLSFYGGLACRDYFCPTYRDLPAAHKEIVKTVCTDWYLYGLVITEDRLLAAFFGEIESRLGRPLAPAEISAGQPAGDALRELFGAKLTLPWPGLEGPRQLLFQRRTLPARPHRLRPHRRPALRARPCLARAFIVVRICRATGASRDPDRKPYHPGDQRCGCAACRQRY